MFVYRLLGPNQYIHWVRHRGYICFDYDHDDDLRILLVGQAKNPESPFEIADWSVKEELAGDWKEKVRRRIRAVNVMIVVCGEYTNTASGVNTEIRIAQDEMQEYFLLQEQNMNFTLMNLLSYRCSSTP